MTRRSMFAKLAAAGPGLLSHLPAVQADGQDLIIRSESRLVLLDVSVKDPRGSFVSGLTRESFTVRENHVPQRISVFSNSDVPLTAGILMDESRSMTPKRGKALAAAETFLRESNPHDQMFVLNFSETVKPGLPEKMAFSSDLGQLRHALHRASPEGRTALYDAVVAGLEHLRLGSRERKALVLISDGGDTVSTHTRRDMMLAVESNPATIYAIGLFEAEDPETDPGVLRQVARISGGEAYFPDRLDALAGICRTIAADMRARYIVGYVPSMSRKRNAWHQIQVQVTVPGRPRLQVRTRQGYRFEPLDGEATLQSRRD